METQSQVCQCRFLESHNDTQFHLKTDMSQIGMGKPIGLGKIQIIPEGLFIIDRVKRYNEDDIFSPNRYHKSWVRNNADFAKLPDTYAKEKQAVALQGIPDFETLRNEFAKCMDEDIKKAIELIGDPQSIEYSVHTPQMAGQDIEQETFKWFVENEKDGTQKQRRVPGQGLKPLDKDSEVLPTLERRILIDEKRRY